MGVKLHVDLETLQLIQGPGQRSSVAALRFKRGDAATLQVVFLENGVTPATIGDPTTLEIQIGIKPRNQFDKSYLAHSADWLMPSEGDDTPTYGCVVSFNTLPLNSALNIGSTTAEELPEITLMGEITWRGGEGEPTCSTRTFIVVVENDVNRGDEGTPAANPDGVDWINQHRPLPMTGEFAPLDEVFPVAQVETAAVLAPTGCTGDGNLPVTVTAACLTGSPVTVDVPLTTAMNTQGLIAQAIVDALNANANIAEVATVTNVTSNVQLTLKQAAANDATLNFAWSGMLGVTEVVNSGTHTLGVAPSGAVATAVGQLYRQGASAPYTWYIAPTINPTTWAALASGGGGGENGIAPPLTGVGPPEFDTIASYVGQLYRAGDGDIYPYAWYVAQSLDPTVWVALGGGASIPIPNTVFVCPITGNDNTGEIGNIAKPYATLGPAFAACQGTGPTEVYVTGTSDPNDSGTYVLDGEWNGMPKYTLDGYYRIICYNINRWEIIGDVTNYPASAGNEAYPDLAAWPNGITVTSNGTVPGLHLDTTKFVFLSDYNDYTNYVLDPDVNHALHIFGLIPGIYVKLLATYTLGGTVSSELIVYSNCRCDITMTVGDNYSDPYIGTPGPSLRFFGTGVISSLSFTSYGQVNVETFEYAESGILRAYDTFLHSTGARLVAAAGCNVVNVYYHAGYLDYGGNYGRYIP